jgi:hypothetical protein
MSLADPGSVDEWLAVCRQHEEAAKLTVGSKVAANQCYFHTIMAAECALKAYIWHVERFNEWPSKEARPDLHKLHNLEKLRKAAKIELRSSDPTAPKWATILKADRNQYYVADTMPRSVAKAMVDAVFGENGVVTWIRQTLRPNS